ncbi:hypothetical protein [Mycolicibacterium iranicum]|uniref:Uncharacterized protein n=1 Tax=Mycolicibacterium iranicum TaxID=912594 RepID=A0A178LNK3_MYCIR|nr:hypothetical protein [Mycolicibacterium iranicum]OAN32623.1 hypothetical protein A4X20_08935 [Mycolicibacterium iranicum]
MRWGAAAAGLILLTVLGGCSAQDEPERRAVEPLVNLDGSFIVEYDGTGTANGAPAAGLTEGKAGWVFRSSCDENRCVAAGGEIADPNNPSAPLQNPRVADYVDGRWVMVNFTENSAACTGPNGEQFTGDVWAIWDIVIAPDMTLAPTITQVGTGNCPSVSTLTPTMTRAGDPLPEFPAPDPSAQPPRQISPAAAFRGSYTLTKARRGDPPGEPEVADIGVATNCLRTADRCVTTATIPGEPGKTNAFLGVYEFADGKFVRTMVPLPADCADGRAGIAAETETLTLPSSAASNPLSELTGELTATFTAVCPGSIVYDVAYAIRPA